ncbi:MAG: hypothetical protein AAEJ57_00830, partial [Opitutales bacterium]
RIGRRSPPHHPQSVHVGPIDLLERGVTGEGVVAPEVRPIRPRLGLKRDRRDGTDVSHAEAHGSDVIKAKHGRLPDSVNYKATATRTRAPGRRRCSGAARRSEGPQCVWPSSRPKASLESPPEPVNPDETVLLPW